MEGTGEMCNASTVGLKMRM